MKSLATDTVNDYDALMLEYACGALDEALSLVVAAHLTLSPAARRIVARYEALGGALIEECCDPVPMSACLDGVLARLDAVAEEVQGCTLKDHGAPQGLPLPGPLCGYIYKDGGPLRWKWYMPGMKAADIAAGCGRYSIRLVRLAPHVRIPAHRHEGVEITLVLDGSFTDEHGRYTRGDLVIHDRPEAHRPVVEAEGCFCLTLTEGPVAPTGWIAAALNRLVRF